MAKAEQCGSHIKLPTTHFQLFRDNQRLKVTTLNCCCQLIQPCFFSIFLLLSWFLQLPNCPCPHLSFSLRVLELCPNSDPPEPGGPSLAVLSPETLGFSPRQWGSILPDYRLVLSQAPDVTRNWQTAGSQQKTAGDNAVLCGQHNASRGLTMERVTGQHIDEKRT